MTDNYMIALRKRTDEFCIESPCEKKLRHMFSDFYSPNERLRMTCRIVWDSFLKDHERDATRNTLTYFANTNEMEETFRTFLSFLFASKKISVDPLSPEEIEQKWRDGGDFILCSKKTNNGAVTYRKSHYCICQGDKDRYEESRGECWCTQIVIGGSNRSIKVNPQCHLIFPSSVAGRTRTLAWPPVLCTRDEINCFQEHTALSTPIFVFDRGGTAKNILSSIVIDGVSAWEYFSVVEIRRDGDIRAISSKSTPSIFIFSDTDHASRFLDRLNGRFAERFERVIALFYDTDRLFPAAVNDGLEMQIAIRPLTDVLERGSDGRFSPNRFAGLQERGIVFSDDVEDVDGGCNEVHRVARKSMKDEWSEFYRLMKSLKRFSDIDILFSVFCMARAIFNQLRQPVFDRDRCDLLAHELNEKVQSFRQQVGDVDEANQASRLSLLIKNILEQDTYSDGTTEKFVAIREFVKTLPETDRADIALAGRHDWIHDVIERELKALGVNVVAKKDARILIHFKRQKKYHKNSDWIFPDKTVRNVWFLFEDEFRELESIKMVYRHLANVGIIDRSRKNEILGFELPRHANDTHITPPGMPDMGVVDVLTTEQILSTFDPNEAYDNDIYSSRIGAVREFVPQLYRELKFESGSRAELTRCTEVIVERENSRKLVSPSELQVGDTVWMMLYDEMAGVSAHGFDDGATLKNRWISVLAELLKTRYERDVGRLVDGVNNELRRQGVGLVIKRHQVRYWLKGCTLRPDGAEDLFKALGVLSGDKDLQEKSSELAYKMSRVNASHQSIGKKVSDSFKDAMMKGCAKVIVGQKKFDVEKYFSKQIICEILDYDDQDDDPEDDVSNKGPFNYLIK